MTKWTERVWLYWVAGGVLATGLYFLLPRGSVAQMAVFLGVNAIAGVAVVAGVRIHRPERRTVWYLLIAFELLYLAASTPWYLALIGKTAPLPYPSYVDALVNLAYLTMVVAIVRLLRDRSTGRDRAGLVDAGIVTIGLGVLFYVFFLEPSIESGGITLGRQLVSASYPLIDVLLLGLLAKLIFSPARRVPALWLLVLAVATQVPGDAVYGLSLLNGDFYAGHPAFAGWMFMCVFVAAAALHPSMRVLSDPVTRVAARPGRWRLVVVAISALIPPVTIMIITVMRATPDRFDVSVLAGVSVVLFALVFVRLSGLVSEVNEHARIEGLKDEFISTVSHELRTPLTSIRGALGLLAGGALGPMSDKGRRMVDIAAVNTDRLGRLINDILDVDRMRSGKVTMDKARCEVAVLVSRTVAEMSVMAASNEVALVVEHQVDAQILADADRIIQVLTNLISNAIKFSPAGGEVRVSTRRSGKEVAFCIEDSGRGVPQNQLQKIFERFEQVDSSDARRGGGTGLGLAISHGIVSQHGGRIWAESGPGPGSKFSFTLPSLDPRPVQAIGPRAPLVLVCDDDPVILDAVGVLLDLEGYRVQVARSGEEALNKARLERPAVLLLDLLMPAMSGWELAARFKEDERTSGIPIVILSVLCATEESSELPDTVIDRLQKPVDEAALAAALRRATGAASGPHPVVVVEDDPGLADILCETFERYGLDPTAAATAEDAIALCRALQPHLVVLDLALLQGSGYDVVQWLRNEGHLGDVPLVVYTASELSPEDRQRLTLGTTRFLTKSQVGPAELESAIAELLAAVTARELAASAA